MPLQEKERKLNGKMKKVWQKKVHAVRHTKRGLQKKQFFRRQKARRQKGNKRINRKGHPRGRKFLCCSFYRLKKLDRGRKMPGMNFRF